MHNLGNSPLSKNSKTGQKIWVAFGKFSAVVVLIATVLGIYRAVLPPGLRLKVRAEYNSFALPPDIVTALADAAGRRLESRWREKLSILREKFPIPDDPNTKERQASARISAYAEGIPRIPDPNSLAGYASLWDRYNRYRGCARLVIRNTGNLPATSVVLDTPLNGVALVASADDSKMPLTFNKTLQLGELRAREWKRVTIWFAEDMPEYYTKNFRITCSQGTGHIAFGRTVYGAWSFLADVDSFSWFLFLLILLALALWGAPLAFRHFIEHRTAAQASVGEAREGKAGPSADRAQGGQEGDGSGVTDQVTN